jgi:hypothetical protein
MPLPDNEETNREFIAAVEEYPVLYNCNLKSYSNRNEQDKVWRQVASLSLARASSIRCVTACHWHHASDI